MMKTHEMVNKMAFLVLMKMYISPIFCRMKSKSIFVKIILKVHPTKGENAFQKLNHITFVT